MQRKDYYVYVHFRATTGEPFYVGKGRGERWLATGGRNVYWKRVSSKHGFYSEKLYENLYQKDAYRIETETIKEFRIHGFRLTNLTCGGDGGIGDIARREIEAAAINRKSGAKRAGLKRRGVKRSPEVIEKMRKASTGRKQGFSEKLKRAMKIRGENHGMYRHKKYALANYKTGESICLTMHQFCEYTGLPKGNVHKMLNGKLLSVGEWCLEGTDQSKIRPINIQRRFWHPEHGEITCTLTELQNLHGVARGNMCNVVLGKRKTCNGWKYLGPSLAPS